MPHTEHGSDRVAVGVDMRQNQDALSLIDLRGNRLRGKACIIIEHRFPIRSMR
jgi:hypothetical protein